MTHPLIHVKGRYQDMSWLRKSNYRLVYFLWYLLFPIQIILSHSTTITWILSVITTLLFFYFPLCAFKKITFKLITVSLFSSTFVCIFKQGAETQWQKANVLLEFGEWLYRQNVSKDDGEQQVHLAIDILLQTERDTTGGAGITCFFRFPLLLILLISSSNNDNYGIIIMNSNNIFIYNSIIWHIEMWKDLDISLY